MSRFSVREGRPTATPFLERSILLSWMRVDDPTILATTLDVLPRATVSQLFATTITPGGEVLGQQIKKLMVDLENQYNSPKRDMKVSQLMKLFDDIHFDYDSTGRYIKGEESIPGQMIAMMANSSLLICHFSWVISTPIAVHLGWRNLKDQQTITNAFLNFVAPAQSAWKTSIAALDAASQELSCELLAADPTPDRQYLTPELKLELKLE